MKLTENFTLEEMTYSETAIRKNLDNTPSNFIIDNLTSLCRDILEPLRAALGVPLKINSGYRSVAVNLAVGGADTSQHCKGQAADTVAIGLTVKDYYAKVKELVNAGQLKADQVIYEYDSWVHISYKIDGPNRGQFLLIKQGTGYIQDIV